MQCEQGTLITSTTSTNIFDVTGVDIMTNDIENYLRFLHLLLECDFDMQDTDMLIDSEENCLRFHQMLHESNLEILNNNIENGNENIKQTSSEIQFAYAVALFGMKLKDNKEVKKMKYADILAIAKTNKGRDEEGYRAEFIQLVETAEMLGR